MPNWCEGSLKLRGKTTDILKFVKEGLNVYKDEAPIDKNEWLEINEVNDDVEIYFKTSDPIYVEGTKRAFLNHSYSFQNTTDYWFDAETDYSICLFIVSQAWCFKPDDWINIAKTYNLDIKLYGVEEGIGFVSDYTILDHGETVVDNSLNYKDYEDFLWNCPFPFIGG